MDKVFHAKSEDIAPLISHLWGTIEERHIIERIEAKHSDYFKENIHLINFIELSIFEQTELTPDHKNGTIPIDIKYGFSYKKGTLPAHIEIDLIATLPFLTAWD